MKPTNRFAFTLVELLTVIAIIAMLVGILLPAVGSSREAARRTQCKNNLRQVGLGLVSYHTANNKFPPGGTISKRVIEPGYSWNVFILPHIEQQSIYDQIDPKLGGSVSPNIRKFKSVEIPAFLCASMPSVVAIEGGPPISPSHYAGISGAGRDNQLIDLEDNVCGDYFVDGLLYPRSETSTAHVKDGQSNTLMVGERAYTTHSWADGAFWFQSPKRDVCMRSTKNVRLPLNGSFDDFGYPKGHSGIPPGAERMLLNDINFGSLHPGGAQFVYVDGHVTFLTDDMDLECLKHLATIRGGEVICE